MKTTQSISCPNCSGRKHIERYGHVADGVCFLCAGNGTVIIDSIKDDELRAQAAANYERSHGRYEVACEDTVYCSRHHNLRDAVTSLLAWRDSIHPSQRADADLGRIWDHKTGRVITRGDIRKAGL